MQQLVLPILILVSTSLFVKCYDFPYTAYLKESFERNFQDRCGKYPFVQQYVQLMDNPNGKQIMFVYQEPRLKNGGLGDRIGGLISAVALALRFNRTLVMRDHSEMHKVFRPYHPTAAEDKYRWDNYQSWSRYNIEYANRDATEYDLWDCINNTGVKNGHCSMIDGDVSQPIILYRSNRAYLCYWHNNPNSVAGKQLNQILGYDSAATVTKEDLFEVAGCMLRLALWPTELLWQEVDKTYKEYGKQINIDHLYATFVTGATQSSSNNKDPKRYLLGKSDEVAKYVGMLNQPNPLSSARNLNVDVTSNSLRDHDRKHHVDPIFYQVGLHFRCGDHNYVGRGGPDKEFCMYKPEKVSNPQYFQTGNPYGLAMCAKEALKNHTLRLIDHHRPVVLGENIVAALFIFLRNPYFHALIR